MIIPDASYINTQPSSSRNAPTMGGAWGRVRRERSVPTPLRTPAQPLSAEYQLMEIARDLIEQTAPLRDELIGRSEDFLAGGFDPTETEQYDITRILADQQSKSARQNLLETLPSGGVLLDKLADVDIGRAHTLTAAGADIFRDEYNRAHSLATGTPLQTGVNLMSSQAQLEAAREQAMADRDAAQKNSLGAAIGGIAGAYFGGPQGAAVGASIGGGI